MRRPKLGFMAQNNALMGTGIALAGLGGLAGGALIANHPETSQQRPVTSKQRVETQTVVVRKVEHRTIRLKPKHVHQSAPPVTRAAPATVVRPAPIVQAVAPRVVASQPVHTRASSGHGTHGEDDAGGERDD